MSHSLSDLLLQYAQQFEDQHAPQNMTIALREAAKELDRLRERLEIDPAHPYDGIYCRDETIRGQDAEITRLTAENERLRAALKMHACDCTFAAQCAVPTKCRNYLARAALTAQEPVCESHHAPQAGEMMENHT